MPRLPTSIRVDFHSHSTASDGRLAPAVLVVRAAAAGVTHLSLTDHDSVAGLLEAAGAARLAGLALVPGIEITATFNGREIHVLGHFLLPGAPGLAAWCGERGGERSDRMRAMVERLAAAGIRVAWADVVAEAAGGTLARPHLARTLVNYGYAAGLQEAFDRYLSPGTPGFVDRPRPTAAEACALVRAAGGTSSIAHPGPNRISRHELADLATQGLDAVEADHGQHPPTQREAYTRWGAAVGLASTGGSDFHSEPPTHGELGTHTTSPADFEVLAARAHERQRDPLLAAALASWLAAGGFAPGHG